MIPNIQPSNFSSGRHWSCLQQCALDRQLHQVVGVVHVAGDGARKAAQPRQQLDDLTAHLLLLDSYIRLGLVVFFPT